MACSGNSTLVNEDVLKGDNDLTDDTECIAGEQQPTSPHEFSQVTKDSCNGSYQLTNGGRQQKTPLLDFSPTEHPPWRSAAAPNTTAMMEEISVISAEFSVLPVRIRERLRKKIAREEAFAYVLNSNRLEDVGTQDWKETLELCERALLKFVPTDRTHRETVQTFAALSHMHDLMTQKLATCASDGAPSHHALVLTPDSIKEVHEVLMRDLVDKPGEYRTNPAYPAGYQFYYTAPEAIDNEMFAWTDAIADIIYGKSNIDLLDCFKLAAQALFRTVDVHPFSDGNGRICRIVANSILEAYHFFPVCLQPVTDDDSDDFGRRKIYIRAIQSCRCHERQEPSDLAALLVESAWTSWLRVRYTLREWVLGRRILIGKIVLGGAVGTAAHERITSRWPLLAHGRRLGAPNAEQQRLDEAALVAVVDTARDGPVAAVLPDDCVVLLYP